MNTQRWLALSVVAAIVAIIVTRPLWTQTPQDETADEAEAVNQPPPTPAPFMTPTQTASEQVEAEALLQPSATTTRTTAEADMEEMAQADGTPEGGGGPFILARGDFVQIDAIHGGEGAATIYQAPDGSRFVRLDPFSVTDAPDLRVALSSHPTPRTQNDLAPAGGFLDLGPLQSNRDAQNYDIPSTARLEQFQSVVIYDKRFNIIFTTATLER